MGYGAAISAIIGAAGGAASAAGQEGTDLSGYGQLPESPDLENNYLEGYFKQAMATPGLLDYENWLRRKYGTQNAQMGADIYSQFLPQYAQANLKALNRVDPNFMKGRDQLFGVVSNELGYGNDLTPGMEQQIQQGVRGAQSARGNILGSANAATEGYALGERGFQLGEQRKSNMQRFLAGPGPTDKFSGLAGAGASSLMNSVGAVSSPGYNFSPDPGNWAQVYYNAAQQEFQNNSTQALARAGAIAGAQPAGNPWLGAVSGAAGGLSGSFGGGGGGGGGFGMGGGGYGASMEGLTPSTGIGAGVGYGGYGGF